MKNIVKFKFPNGEAIKIKYLQNKKKKFVARAPSLNFYSLRKILIDELFFKFPYNEQVSIMYHELWHYNENWKFELYYRTKKPWLWLCFFINKPIQHAQEFNADLYALKMTNKKDTLAMLKRLEGMIKEGILPKSHEKTHPPIKERIKIIKEVRIVEECLVRKDGKQKLL